jgi:hypothetical protein
VVVVVELASPGKERAADKGARRLSVQQEECKKEKVNGG